MAALGTAISALQNMNSDSAAFWTQAASTMEYLLKMKLDAIEDSIGKISTKILHELSDYPQTVMAGIIAAQFFTHQSKVVFWGFAVVPWICKFLKYVKGNSKLFEAPDHMIRILGKVITTGQAIVNCYRTPEYVKFIHGTVLIITCMKDINNTQSYLRDNCAHYYWWNWRVFKVGLV